MTEQRRQLRWEGRLCRAMYGYAGLYRALYGYEVSIKHGLRIADYGLRVGYKQGLGIKGGLRTADWV